MDTEDTQLSNHTLSWYFVQCHSLEEVARAHGVRSPLDLLSKLMHHYATHKSNQHD